MGEQRPGPVGSRGPAGRGGRPRTRAPSRGRWGKLPWSCSSCCWGGAKGTRMASTPTRVVGDPLGPPEPPAPSPAPPTPPTQPRPPPPRWCCRDPGAGDGTPHPSTAGAPAWGDPAMLQHGAGNGTLPGAPGCGGSPRQHTHTRLNHAPGFNPCRGPPLAGWGSVGPTAGQLCRPRGRGGIGSPLAASGMGDGDTARGGPAGSHAVTGLTACTAGPWR